MDTSKYEAMRAQMATIRKQMESTARQLMKDGARELFEKYPKLESFSWEQYTPYFNDGDECIFSVHNYPGVVVDGKKYGDLYECQDEELGTEDVGELYGEVEQLISVFDEDDMKAAYGDHAQITVNRKGIEIEQIEHD